MRLTQKQETFCLKYFELGNMGEAALVAGYSPKTAPFIGSENLKKPQIIERIGQLRQIAEDASIATVLERKQVLTEIVRGRFIDFMSKPTKEKLQSAALQEIRITEVGKGIPIKTTTIKLHSAIQAIAELNKMEKVYEVGDKTIINNQLVNVNVVSENSRRLTEEIIGGIGTE